MNDEEKIKKQVSDILYENIYEPYCDDCRFYFELDKDDFKKQSNHIYSWGCDHCIRKEMGWAISREKCEELSHKIIESIKEIDSQKLNIMFYKGFYTEIHYCSDSKVLYGKIENITDFVYFESDNCVDIEIEFHRAVDEYIDFLVYIKK